MKLNAADRKLGMTLAEAEAALRLFREANASDDAPIRVEASISNRVKSISCHTITLLKESPDA